MFTNNPYYSTVRNLRTIRLRHRIPRSRLAKQTGMTVQRIRDIENGKEIPNLYDLRVISHALMLSVTITFHEI